MFCLLLGQSFVLPGQEALELAPRLAPPHTFSSEPASSSSATSETLGTPLQPSASSQPVPDSSGEISSARTMVLPPALGRSENPWGPYAPKTRLRMRTTSTTFADDKITTRVADKVIELEAIDGKGYNLKTSTSVDLGGKRFQADPQVVRYDFFQQPILEGLKVMIAKPSRVQIGSVIIPCQVRIYEQESTDWRQQTILWYSTSIYPYILRNETTKTMIPTPKEPEGRILSYSLTTVLGTSALAGPIRSRFGTYSLQTIRKSGGTTTMIHSSCSRHLPGGVVSETSRETDHDGKLLSQSDSFIIDSETVFAVNSGGEIPVEPFHFNPRRNRVYVPPSFRRRGWDASGLEQSVPAPALIDDDAVPFSTPVTGPLSP